MTGKKKREEVFSQNCKKTQERRPVSSRRQAKYSPASNRPDDGLPSGAMCLIISQTALCGRQDMKSRVFVVGVLAAIILAALAFRAGEVQAEKPRSSEDLAAKEEAGYDWQLADPRWQQQALRHERPIHF